MKRAMLAALAAAAIALPLAPGRAEDSVRLSRSSSLIGEHLVMQIEVLAPPAPPSSSRPVRPAGARSNL
jgi:hypothetical protein